MIRSRAGGAVVREFWPGVSPSLGFLNFGVEGEDVEVVVEEFTGEPFE